MLRSSLITSSLRRLAAIALGLSALGAPSLALAQDAQVESGFALQANLGMRTSLLNLNGPGNAGGNLALPISTLDTQLFFGYKTGRLLIGLGIEFLNSTVNEGATVAGVNTSISTTHSAFLIGPEVQFAIVRSPDSRVELVGDLALHFGHDFQNTSMTPAPPPNNNPTDSNFLLTYQIGPGVRFWAHKHFAITGLTGFAGGLYHYIPASNAPPGESYDQSAHGVFGSFGMLGVF